VCLSCDKERVVDSSEFTAPDATGNEINWVTYVYRKAEPMVIPVGDSITETSYTKTLPGGQFQTIFHEIQKFYQIDDDWYELLYETVTKETWDEA